MRLRLLAPLGLATVLVMAGCTPAPDVSPSPSASAPDPTPTPTEEPIVAPEAAFDVTCSDVNSAVAGVLGASVGGEKDVLGLTSTPIWYPGPAQYMMQQAGGIACSAGDPVQLDPNSTSPADWSIAVVPNAQAIIDGAAERGASDIPGDGIRCYTGSCTIELRDGDVLMTGSLRSSALVESDADRVREAMAGVLASAVATLRDFEPGQSKIAGARCETLLTAQEASEILGREVVIMDYTELGGWGTAAEIYFASEGAQYCMYATGPDPYGDPTLVALTTLPSGAWAFEKLDAGSPVSLTGADAALTGVDFYGRTVLDARVGADWLRFTVPVGEDASSVTSVAEATIEHLTRGRPAPQ